MSGEGRVGGMKRIPGQVVKLKVSVCVYLKLPV